MARSLVVKVTCGPEDAERLNQAFTVAEAIRRAHAYEDLMLAYAAGDAAAAEGQARAGLEAATRGRATNRASSAPPVTALLKQAAELRHTTAKSSAKSSTSSLHQNKYSHQDH